ncbi:hypothetical protein [Tenacibaculum sp. A30]|uniref:hypothetical protein n=1 Tax=Tenacibaculum sp. A30 TaxID=3442644 RepID=UPI003EBDB30E
MEQGKKQITNLLKLGVFLFGISLLLWNCENENMDIDNQQNAKIQEQFTLENFEDEFVKNNLVVDWDNYIKIDNKLNNVITYEFNTFLTGKSTPPNKGQNLFYRYKVLATEKSLNEFSFNIIKFVANSKKEVEEASYIQTNTFTGTIQEYNLLGETIKIEAYKKGELVSEIDNKLKIHNNYASKTPYMGRYILVVTDYYVDWYKGGGDGNFVYMLSSYESTSVEYVYIEDEYTGGDGGDTQTYHSHYDAPHGPSLGLNNHSVEKILDNTRNPCVSTIIKELQKKDMKGALVPDLEGKGHLSQTILDLFDHSQTYNLTFNVGQLNTLGSGVSGNTKGFDITLDTDLVKDATKLFIAKTVIHESLHAYIHYIMRENPGSTMTSTLKKYFSKYNSSNLTEHEFMGQYVEALAYSLSSYDNHQQPMDYYKALSWAGLESSSAYQALSNKTQIEKIIKNERLANNNAKSTKC